ncbi:MAG: ABC transporter permease, partial [Bacteroidota bacterium]
MTSGEKPSPPRFFDRLLEWYCDERYLEEIQGALYEYFYESYELGRSSKARWLFAVNVIAHCRPHLWKKSKTKLKINNMLVNHLKISLRNLWKHRLNTSLNLLGLSMGITVFLFIMLWVHHETSYDGYHEKADHIYRISNTFRSESEEFSQAISGPALGAQLPEAFSAISAGVRVGQSSAQVEIDGQLFFEDRILVVDDTFFEVFDFDIVQGNADNPFDPLNGVVITESLAKKYFGDENPLGQAVVTDNEDPLVVSAVVKDAPPNSQLQYSMLISMDLLKDMYGMPNMDDEWGGGWFYTYLVMQDGVAIDQLEEEINAHILPKLQWFTERNMSYEYFLQPLTSIHLASDLRYDFGSNGSTQNVLIFLIVGIVILLLACINYVNLSTAAAINRAKEVGIKRVIGASRKVIFFQHLTETTVVLLCSALLSVVLVITLLPYVQDFVGTPLAIPPLAWVAVGTLASALLLGVMTGLLPASIISAFHPLKVIKGAVSGGRSGQLVRRLLVIVQFA